MVDMHKIMGKMYFALNDTGLLRALHSRNPQKHS